MSQLTDAADALLRHIAQNEAFKTAANALYRLDSLATAETEAQGRLDAIGKKAIAAQAALEKTLAEHEDSKAQLAQIRAEADQAAEVSRNAAISESEYRIGEANKQAKAILEDAKAEYNRIKEQAETEAAVEKSAADKARADADAAKKVLAGLQAEIDTADASLAALNGKIKTAQAKIASMLS